MGHGFCSRNMCLCPEILTRADQQPSLIGMPLLTQGYHEPAKPVEDQAQF